MTQPANRRLGKIELGGFRLFEVLGEGAFGTAYLAEQLGTDRKAVVKIAHAHLVNGPSAAGTRSLFDAEIRAASRVHHPSLVTLYTAGTTADGLPAMATEYIAGRTLGAELDEGMSRPEIQIGFEQIGAGLAALHREGIVHRDLSPENVMVSRGPAGVVAKIIDFGVAKLLDRAASGRHAIGTPRYIAPEQLRGAAQPASDMYALGALLHFALTGREHLHDIQNVTDLIAHVAREEPPPPLRRLAEEVTPEEDTLVCELLSPRPEARPTAGEFLIRWANLAGVPVRRALLVHEDLASAGALEQELRALGYTLETTSQPQRASRAAPHEFELVVVSAGLPGVDPVALVGHLEEYLPAQEIWVVGTRFGVAWQNVKRARCVSLPDDLPRLASMTPHAPPVGARARTPLPGSARPDSSPRSKRSTHRTLDPSGEALIGGGADLIATLSDAAARLDRAVLASASDRLASLADGAGAAQLASLARALGAVAGTSVTEGIDALLDETQSAYRAAVRALLAG